jgi:signal transduction histidine kinase/Tfp pilus assembly protein PilF
MSRQGKTFAFLWLLIALLPGHRLLHAQSPTGDLGSQLQNVNSLLGDNNDSAEVIIRRVLKTSIQSGNSRMIARSYLALSNLYFYRSQPDLAAKSWNVADRLNAMNKDPQLTGNLHLSKALLHQQAGNFDSAIVREFRALRCFEQLPDEEGMMKICLIIGGTFQLTGRYDLAKKYLDRALSLAQKRNDTTFTGLVYHSLGNMCQRSGDISRSIRYYKIANDKLRATRAEGRRLRVLLSLASSYEEEENYGEAVHLYQECIAGFKIANDAADLCIAFENLGVLYMRTGEFAVAQSCFEKAYRIIRRSGDLNALRNITYNLAALHANRNNYKQAYLYLDTSNQYKDSIFSAQKQKIMDELNAQYESEIKDRKIAMLAQDAQIQAVKHQSLLRQRLLLILSLASVLTITSLLILIYIQRYRKEKVISRQKEKIHMQTINELLKTQELKSINAMLEGEERERSRISEDLHDRLGALLSTVKMGFSTVESKISVLEEENRKNFSNSLTLLDRAVEEVRTISHNLASGILANFGFEVALLDLKETVTQNTGLVMDLRITGLDAQRLPPSLEINLYRMVQELLNNTLKHAGATRFSIDINKSMRELVLVVHDNGAGFDPAVRAAGIGLKNLESRVTRLNGSMHIDSGKGNGSTFIIEIPLT